MDESPRYNNAVDRLSTMLRRNATEGLAEVSAVMFANDVLRLLNDKDIFKATKYYLSRDLDDPLLIMLGGKYDLTKLLCNKAPSGLSGKVADLADKDILAILQRESQSRPKSIKISAKQLTQALSRAVVKVYALDRHQSLLNDSLIMSQSADFLSHEMKIRKRKAERAIKRLAKDPKKVEAFHRLLGEMLKLSDDIKYAKTTPDSYATAQIQEELHNLLFPIKVPPFEGRLAAEQIQRIIGGSIKEIAVGLEDLEYDTRRETGLRKALGLIVTFRKKDLRYQETAGEISAILYK